MLKKLILKKVNKVRKRSKIQNRYNQAPYLTQDTNGKATTTQLDVTNESQEVSPFPAGAQKHENLPSIQKENNYMYIDKYNSARASLVSQYFYDKSL